MLKLDLIYAEDNRVIKVFFIARSNLQLVNGVCNSLVSIEDIGFSRAAIGNSGYVVITNWGEITVNVSVSVNKITSTIRKRLKSLIIQALCEYSQSSFFT